MGWEKFTELTRTIQTKYKNHDIDTNTLARETNAILGYDMFPFFDQWIRDQGIPKIHYSWKAEKDPDGKFIVSLRVRQEDSENFKYLMVPISFDFGKGDPVTIMKPILEANTTIKVRVPMRPKEVRMDDEGTQLARFIYDKAASRR